MGCRRTDFHEILADSTNYERQNKRITHVPFEPDKEIFELSAKDKEKGIMRTKPYVVLEKKRGNSIFLQYEYRMVE